MNTLLLLVFLLALHRTTVNSEIPACYKYLLSSHHIFRHGEALPKICIISFKSLYHLYNFSAASHRKESDSYRRDVSNEQGDFIIDPPLSFSDDITNKSSNSLDAIAYDNYGHLNLANSGQQFLTFSTTPQENSPIHSLHQIENQQLPLWSQPLYFPVTSYPNASSMMDTLFAPEINSDAALVDTNIVQWKCNFPGCQTIQEFPTQRVLDKHVEKAHTKPYICTIPDCKHPRFGDKASLDRHKREVHGSQSFPCPIRSCKRHTRPFHREYNVSDHLKRCHGQSSYAPAFSLSRSSNPVALGTGDKLVDSQQPASPNSVGSRDEGKNQTQIDRLRARLDRLRAARAELDADIKALERTVEIMEDS